MSRSRDRNCSIKVLYSNVNSLFNKVNELSVLAIKESVQIICITETKVNSSISDAEIALPNFTLFREDSKNNTRYCGSAIYVHCNLKAERLDWFKGQ